MVDKDDAELVAYHMKTRLEILAVVVFIGFYYVREPLAIIITIIIIFYVLVRVMEVIIRTHEKMHVRFDTNENGNLIRKF